MKPRAIRRSAALVALMSLTVVSEAWGRQQNPSSVRDARPPSATQADSALDASTRELAAQLRCPVCQGLSIQDSPSELAQQMRDVVRQQLHDGQTPDQVKQFFVARYGQWILMAPPASGFNWLVYALPALALVGGIAVVAVLVRRWTTASVASGAVDALPVPDPSDATQ